MVSRSHKNYYGGHLNLELDSAIYLTTAPYQLLADEWAYQPQRTIICANANSDGTTAYVRLPKAGDLGKGIAYYFYNPTQAVPNFITVQDYSGTNLFTVKGYIGRNKISHAIVALVENDTDAGKWACYRAGGLKLTKAVV